MDLDWEQAEQLYKIKTLGPERGVLQDQVSSFETLNLAAEKKLDPIITKTSKLDKEDNRPLPFSEGRQNLMKAARTF